MDEIEIPSTEGPLRARYRQAAGEKAVLWLGGSGNGFVGPEGLFDEAVEALAGKGIASLWLAYRKPGDMGACLFDALTGWAALQGAGAETFGAVGYSFGGAVAAQAAARRPGCRFLVTLATQSEGVEAIAHLRDGCATLLLHGLADTVVPAGCTQYAHSLAPEPKKMLLVPEEGHGLEGARELAVAWIRRWAERYMED